MAQFRMKRGPRTEAFGYVFEPGKITEVRDDDAAALRKLRGDAKSSHAHPDFEEVK